MKKRYAITQEDFDLIKLLSKNGLSHIKIHQITNRSTSTISLILRSENIAEYRELYNIARSPKYDKNNTIQSQTAHTEDRKNTPSISPDEQKILINLTDALVEMATWFKEISPKLDEVIAAKRPWLRGR